MKIHPDVMNFRIDLDDRLESKIQTSILRYLKTVPHSNFAKIAQGKFSQIGVSDIVGCYMGKFVAMEVKRRLTEPTPLQIQYLNDTVGAGGFGAIVRSVGDAREVLKHVEYLSTKH